LKPQELTIDLAPEYRFEVIDLRKKILEMVRSEINRYRKATYCSYHTTAGFLEQSLCSRLDNQIDNIRSYIKFSKTFPDQCRLCP
jgi:hypothetical protein